MNFSKVIHFLSKNKKQILFFAFLSLAFFPELSFAAEFKFDDFKSTVVNVLDWLLSFSAAILWILTYLVSLFLDPGWINWSFFWMNAIFRSIWILISNVVYFIFALLLIWIAFMNILWRWETWELKQALPRFIIWVLIVPFTWFFVQLMLSISAVLTVSVLTLPSDTFNSYNSNIETIDVYKTCDVNLSSKAKEETAEGGNVKWFIYCYPEETMKLWDLLKIWDASTSIFWIVYTYTYWVMAADKLDDLWKGTILNNVKNIADLILKVLTDFLFVLVYVILIIALWVVLMVRWIYLWLYMMFSPLFWLLFFFKKTDWSGEWFFSKFSIKEFISLAMVPVYTMAALSFWLLFIFVVWHGMTWKSTQESTDSLKSWSITVEKDKITIWEWDNWFTLNINWASSSSDDGSVPWAYGIFKDTADWALWFIWTIILQIFWIVILRWAMMAAMRTSDITKTIVEPIYSFGNQVWGLVARIPQYTPIFPGGQSMNSMQQIWSSAKNYYESTKPWKTSRNFMEQYWLFWGESSNIDAKDIKSLLESNQRDKISRSVRQAVERAWESKVASNKPELIDSLLAVARQLDPKWEYKDKKVSDIRWKQQEYVNLVSHIDRFINDKYKWSWAVDIIDDWGSTKQNLSIDKYNERIKTQRISWARTPSIDNTLSEQKISKNEVNSSISIWWKTLVVEMNNQWKIIKLKNAVDEIAKYISDNNFDENKYKEFAKSLDLDNTVKDELDGYFKDNDWKIVFDSNGEWNKSLQDFLDSNKDKS